MIGKLLPPMSAEERRPLRNDLVMHGLRVPIIRHAGMVLEGWYRYQLCIEESIEPRFEDYADDDPFGLVRSLNLSRRHLTLAQKKEVAKHIFEREPGRTANSVAQEVGLAPHTAQKVQDNISNLKNSNKTGLPAGGAAELPPAEPAKSRNPVARLVDANLSLPKRELTGPTPGSRPNGRPVRKPSQSR